MVRHDELDRLLRPRIESVALVSKPPPNHGRGAGPVLATLLGMVVGAVGAGTVFDSAFAALGGMLFGMVGYRKHFWKTILIRRPRLSPVAGPVPPDAAVFVGTVQAHEATVSTLEPGAVAVVTSVVLRSAAQRDGMVLRAVRAVPFWLVGEKRRILVTGGCWVGSPGQRREVGHLLAALEIPTSLVPKRPFAEEAWISPGDRVAVIGEVRQQHVPGLGYRESTIETIAGEPGAVVWIERTGPAS